MVFFSLTKPFVFVIIINNERISVNWQYRLKYQKKGKPLPKSKGAEILMKLIIAIVNNDDAHFVNTGLTAEGYQITKISSTGGFLLNGNSTFFVGVEDDRVDRAIEIIKAHSKKRVKNIPAAAMQMGASSGSMASVNADVSVGGATVFILDVEKFMHF